MERKNLIGSALMVMGLSNRATFQRGIKLALPLLAAVMLTAVALLPGTFSPARTAEVHEGTDHTHVCTRPPAESCPTYDDDAQPERTVWSSGQPR